jgi:hypothetical protein
MGYTRAPRAGAKSRTATVRDEAGSVLILALVFLVTVGGVIGALVSWVGNDLVNTTHFNSARSAQYAAGGATEVAIWNARYHFPTSLNPTVPCQNNVSIDNEPIDVWCSTVLNPPLGDLSITRAVTFSACPHGLSEATCTGSPLLRAVVYFDDFSTSANNEVDTCPTSPLTCGTGMTVVRWVFNSSST